MSELEKSNKLSDATLNSLKTVEDAIRALGVSDQSELDWNESQWKLLEDKSKLIGKKFLAVQWRFQQSKEYLGSEFVSVYLITADTIDGENTFVINDGSTGICQQLRTLTDTRLEAGHKTPQSGALVKGGLKLSEYDRTDEKGTVIGKGKTYYLSN